MKTFMDMETSERMEVRSTVEGLGGECDIVAGAGQLVVRMPNDSRSLELSERLMAMDLPYERSAYFPIGSEDVASHLRHSGGYRDMEPGFLLLVKFGGKR